MFRLRFAPVAEQSHHDARIAAVALAPFKQRRKLLTFVNVEHLAVSREAMTEFIWEIRERQLQRGTQTAVGVVTFHPEPNRICELIALISEQALAILVYANSPIDDELQTRLRAHAGRTPMHIIGGGNNCGLGIAYNTLVQWAVKIDARYLLLFDQDSTPPREMIVRLEEAVKTLAKLGTRPAMVGPQPITENTDRFKISQRRQPTPNGTLIPVDFVISSGAMIVLEAAQSVGRFREDYFIDVIDIEWCLRAWHAGWSVWLARDLQMVHRLGRGIIRLPFGIEITDQPPRRLYTYLRNQLAMLRLKHVPWSRKLRIAVSLPVKCGIYIVRNGFSRAVITAVATGLWHGTLNKLGPPHRVWKRIEN